MEAVSISSKKTKIYMKNHIKALADKIKRLESKITLHSSNKNNATLMIRKKQIEDSLRELRIYQRALSIYTRNEAETRLKKLKKLRPTQSSKKDEMSKEKKAQNNLEADNENNFNNTNKERKKEDNENNGKLKYIKEQSSQPLFSSTIDHKNQIEQMLDGDIKQMLDSDYSEEKIAKNVYNNYDKIA